jgi:hypothetical protein
MIKQISGQKEGFSENSDSREKTFKEKLPIKVFAIKMSETLL